jgi:predicted transcriptional regulator
MADPQRTLIINVASLEEVKARALGAARGRPAEGRVRSFATLDLLWRTFSPKRLDILRAMAGQPPMSIREIARRVRRDVKAVHADVHALLHGHVLSRTEDGRIVFPYDEVRIDVTIRPEIADSAA